jgi:hypothetical protein
VYLEEHAVCLSVRTTGWDDGQGRDPTAAGLELKKGRTTPPEQRGPKEGKGTEREREGEVEKRCGGHEHRAAIRRWKARQQGRRNPTKIH